MPNALDASDPLDSLLPLDGAGLTFTPPVLYDMGPINPDTTGLERRLFGHYSPHARGLNIWVLPDGTYTQDQPYPLITPQDVQDGIGRAATYKAVYYGGHVYELSAAEAAALTAAGYGGNIV